ncbi:hypothetical protein HK101_006767, partial [Irineochytrium annulatum]
STDAGFSCAWNQTSDKFAVASQDGYVCVWDIRSSEKLVKLGSKQHVSYVNLVDARTFNDRQLLRVSPTPLEHHISGCAFSPDSKTIFVGLENTVLEYDVNTISRRSFSEGSII